MRYYHASLKINADIKGSSPDLTSLFTKQIQTPANSSTPASLLYLGPKQTHGCNTMASSRAKILALASPTLDSDRALRLRCVAEAQALDDDGCEIAKGAMEAGE
jgi:hypothetical protein